MGKAILILPGMPDDCGECPLHDYEGVGCYATHKVISCDIGQSKPDWCPLREMPPETKLYPEEQDKEWSCGYVSGYNACLRDVEGSSE